MFVKKIEYVDFMGNKRSEEFMFNLTEAEIAELEFGQEGGFTAMVRRISSTQNMPEIIKMFKNIICKSYGEISPDGRRFIKTNDAGVPLAKYFTETNAYSNLYIELATNSKSASEFVIGIMPGEVSEKLKGIDLENVDLTDVDSVNNIIKMG